MENQNQKTKIKPKKFQVSKHFKKNNENTNIKKNEKT